MCGLYRVNDREEAYPDGAEGMALLKRHPWGRRSVTVRALSLLIPSLILEPISARGRFCSYAPAAATPCTSLEVKPAVLAFDETRR